MRKFIINSIFITLITSFICSMFGQALLKIVHINTTFAPYLIIFMTLVLYITKYSDHQFQIKHLGMRAFIENAKQNSFKPVASIPFISFLITNTLLAHLTGASVGREGVAIQLGGAIGSKFSQSIPTDKHYYVRLGMICGFSALFQTPLAAFVFILEILAQEKHFETNKLHLISYITFSFISCYFSHLIGLEKFFVGISVDFGQFNILFMLKLLLGSIIAIGIGILFVIVLKTTKQKMQYPYIICCGIILCFIALQYRYNSLGTNLIHTAFYQPNLILQYDFLFKLLFTCLCIAIGFKGGEVTPLFAIGASFGVIFAIIFQLPILIMAALGYVLVFGSSTKTTITPIFLLLEVFSWHMMLIGIIPCLCIKLLNKKYSIYH